MKRLLLSDVHLGAPKSRAARLLRFLKATPHDQLVIVGDLFHSGKLAHLSPACIKLIAYLRKHPNFVFVAGNHDHGILALAAELFGLHAVEEYVWFDNDRPFLAIHGHQFDEHNREPRWYTDFIIWLSHWFPVHWFDGWHTKWSRLKDKVRKGALDHADYAANVDVVFCGHTHEFDRGEQDGVHYVNLGSWTRDMCYYAMQFNGKIETGGIFE